MGRPRQPLLNHERIVAAALDLVDTAGLEAVSTRRLAAALGVSGPSLYNHVATKESLLDAVVDLVLGEVDTGMFAGLGAGPGRGDRDWRRALDAWARSYHAVLAAHPNIVPALAQGVVRRHNALLMADAVYGGLVAAGWPRREATRVGTLMRYFITGSALGSFAGGFPTDAALYHRDYPHLEGAHRLASRQTRINEDAFDMGLEALLDGLEARWRRLGS